MPQKVLILIPLFNDWASLRLLIPRIDRALEATAYEADLLVVDDASTEEAPAPLLAAAPHRIARASVLTLRRNLGHQRAIAVGLSYAEARLDHDLVVVMDGDGEDDPADIPRLIQAALDSPNASVVFAARTRRSESPAFQFFYKLYKLLHRVLTGQGVRVGNFSVIPRRRLESLVAVDALWNHYAAAVFRSRQPYTTIPTRRASRLSGRSQMDFVQLVTHGLSAISVYSDVVGVRLLVLTVLLGLLALVALAATLAVRLLTTWAIPGWATFAAGLSLMLFLQAAMMAALLSFVILGARQSTSFLPCRDYVYFIAGLRPLFADQAGLAPRTGT